MERVVSEFRFGTPEVQSIKLRKDCLPLTKLVMN